MKKHFATLSKKELREIQLKSVVSRKNNNKFRDMSIVIMYNNGEATVSELSRIYKLKISRVYQIIREYNDSSSIQKKEGK
jgi:Mor family transcriptional regulator